MTGMDRKKLLKCITHLIFFIFVLNLLADTFYWYSSIWYFDMPMHFLGGFWLGLVFFYIFSFKDYSLNYSVFKILFFVLLVGIGWEVFELFTVNYLSQDVFHTFDTISDLFFDLAGGGVSIFYVLKKIMPVPENTV